MNQFSTSKTLNQANHTTASLKQLCHSIFDESLVHVPIYLYYYSWHLISNFAINILLLILFLLCQEMSIHASQQNLLPWSLKPDPYRYINLVFFLLAAIINSAPTQALAGIAPTVQERFEVSQLLVSLNSLCFPLGYVLVLQPVSYIIDKYGLKISTLLCEMFMIIGLSVRLLVGIHFYFFLIGTGICSFGFLFMVNSGNKFANTWFPSDKVTLINSLVMFAIFTSDALGYSMSTYIIDKNSTKQEIQNYLKWNNLISIAIQALMVIFFRGRPKNPQNFAFQKKQNKQKVPYLKQLKTLLTNRDYLKILGSTTMIFAALTTIYVFLPWIARAHGYTQAFGGRMLVIANISGLFSCVALQVKFPTVYKKKVIVTLVMTILTLILLGVSFEFKLTAAIYICSVILGFSIYPYLNTMIDFGTQVSYPIGEAAASGNLLVLGQLLGLGMVIFLSIIEKGQSKGSARVVSAVILSMFLIGLLSISRVRQTLKRSQAQKEGKLEHEKDSLLSNPAQQWD